MIRLNNNINNKHEHHYLYKPFELGSKTPNNTCTHEHLQKMNKHLQKTNKHLRKTHKTEENEKEEEEKENSNSHSKLRKPQFQIKTKKPK